VAATTSYNVLTTTDLNTITREENRITKTRLLARCWRVGEDSSW